MNDISLKRNYWKGAVI